MRTIFDACTPRPEVLSRELKEEQFAARLKDVLDGTADPIYQNPATFFANTYPTAGLKLLLTEALGRLTGLRPANNPNIRLETAFGGGKTHKGSTWRSQPSGTTRDLSGVACPRRNAVTSRSRPSLS